MFGRQTALLLLIAAVATALFTPRKVDKRWEEFKRKYNKVPEIIVFFSDHPTEIR